MRTVNLVLLLVAVVLSATTAGCSSSSDAAVAPDTTPGGYVTRPEFEAFQGAQRNNWQENSKTLKDYNNKIMENTRAIAAYGQQLESLRGNSATSISGTLTSLGAQPTIRGGSAGPTTCQHSDHTHTCTGNIPAGTSSPGVASYDLPPHLAAYVKERFDKSDAKQTEILGKEDTIIGKLDEVATAVKGLTDKVTKIEQRLPAPNSPVRPKPEVPQPE